MTVRRELSAVWLGRRRYEPVHALMQRLHVQRSAGLLSDTVLFVEHEAVVTLGRGAQASHVLLSAPQLSMRGVDLVSTGRGGDVTLHAPGQLVCYPIVDLMPDRCDVRRYVRDLTETMRRLAHDHGVGAGPSDRYIGLWVDRNDPGAWPGDADALRPAKLGAIGVRVSRWVTQHGFAFNLTTDLDLFQLIVPCGIADYGVTSLYDLTGAKVEVRSAAERALQHLGDVLDADIAGFEDRSQTSLEGLLVAS